jgi:hypothetical protein
MIDPSILILMSIPILPSVLVGLLIVMLLRKWVRGKTRLRTVLTLVLMLVGFAVSFSIAAYLLVGTLMGVANYYRPEINITPENEDQVFNELLQREFMPDAVRPNCLTTAEVCAIAEDILDFGYYSGNEPRERMSQGVFPFPLPITLILALIAAAINGALSWYSTRSKNAVEPITPPVLAG